jgi:hypothetical protein
MAEIAADPDCVHIAFAGHLKHFEKSSTTALGSIMVIVDGAEFAVRIEGVPEHQAGNLIDELHGTDGHV